MDGVGCELFFDKILPCRAFGFRLYWYRNILHRLEILRAKVKRSGFQVQETLAARESPCNIEILFSSLCTSSTRFESAYMVWTHQDPIFLRVYFLRIWIRHEPVCHLALFWSCCVVVSEPNGFPAKQSFSGLECSTLSRIILGGFWGKRGSCLHERLDLPGCSFLRMWQRGIRASGGLLETCRRIINPNIQFDNFCRKRSLSFVSIGSESIHDYEYLCGCTFRLAHDNIQIFRGRDSSFIPERTKPVATAAVNVTREDL
jgi:hypothetical protein